MRIYEGDYAYEIEQVFDRATQLSSGWRYNVYRIRPLNELLCSGEASTRALAEQVGKRELSARLKPHLVHSTRRNRIA